MSDKAFLDSDYQLKTINSPKIFNPFDLKPVGNEVFLIDLLKISKILSFFYFKQSRNN